MLSPALSARHRAVTRVDLELDDRPARGEQLDLVGPAAGRETARLQPIDICIDPFDLAQGMTRMAMDRQGAEDCGEEDRGQCWSE